tara:strand:- start:149 stop:523 length:375 start_codon:yes stop_codon:yes gene_type:complete
VNDDKKKEELFFSGLNAYAEGKYFDAHEIWEELWSEYYLKDRDFIQGLIQLAVCFVHLENGNMNGARSLLNKSTKKLIGFSKDHRNINVKELMKALNELYINLETINNAEEFDWSTCPKILLNE